MTPSINSAKFLNFPSFKLVKEIRLVLRNLYWFLFFNFANSCKNYHRLVIFFGIFFKCKILVKKIIIIDWLFFLFFFVFRFAYCKILVKSTIDWYFFLCLLVVVVQLDS